MRGLRNEFAGQSELCFLHAQLVVLIRREYKTKETYAQFVELWQAQEKYLLNALNTRWLLSATDTFIDHSTDAGIRASGIACAMLINTCRMYETELAASAIKMSQPQIKNEQILIASPELWDGVRALGYSAYDTIYNAQARLNQLITDLPNCITARILNTLLHRLHHHNTAYKRALDRQTPK